MKLHYKNFFILFVFTLVMGNDLKIKYKLDADKIYNYLETDSLAYNRLAYLCDMFGPRLSASKNLEKAIDWIIKEMKKDGFSNVRGERVKVPAWIRGSESLKILVPFELSLIHI